MGSGSWIRIGFHTDTDADADPDPGDKMLPESQKKYQTKKTYKLRLVLKFLQYLI